METLQTLDQSDKKSKKPKDKMTKRNSNTMTKKRVTSGQFRALVMFYKSTVYNIDLEHTTNTLVLNINIYQTYIKMCRSNISL